MNQTCQYIIYISALPACLAPRLIQCAEKFHSFERHDYEYRAANTVLMIFSPFSSIPQYLVSLSFLTLDSIQFLDGGYIMSSFRVRYHFPSRYSKVVLLFCEDFTISYTNNMVASINMATLHITMSCKLVKRRTHSNC